MQQQLCMTSGNVYRARWSIRWSIIFEMRSFTYLLIVTYVRLSIYAAKINAGFKHNLQFDCCNLLSPTEWLVVLWLIVISFFSLHFLLFFIVVVIIVVAVVVVAVAIILPWVL